MSWAGFRSSSAWSIICSAFYAKDVTFLSSRNLVNMTLFAAPVGVISLGIVLVLLLGEIDLSVGSVSGFAAASMAVWSPTRGTHSSSACLPRS